MALEPSGQTRYLQSVTSGCWTNFRCSLGPEPTIPVQRKSRSSTLPSCGSSLIWPALSLKANLNDLRSKNMQKQRRHKVLQNKGQELDPIDHHNKTSHFVLRMKQTLPVNRPSRGSSAALLVTINHSLLRFVPICWYFSTKQDMAI